MVQLRKLYRLMEYQTYEEWRHALFKLAENNGFSQMLFGIVPSRSSVLENSFMVQNFNPQWRGKYIAEKLHEIDPTVTHCISSAVPIIWPAGSIASIDEQHFYEEARAYGLHSGITFPIHGPEGQFGMLSFVAEDSETLKKLESFAEMASLSLIRDYIVESSIKFSGINQCVLNVKLTQRELECLKWIMEGKSSWEAAQILKCSEATANFHMSNIKRKFNVSTRQQAVVKAIMYGLISPN